MFREYQSQQDHVRKNVVSCPFIEPSLFNTSFNSYFSLEVRRRFGIKHSNFCICITYFSSKHTEQNVSRIFFNREGSFTCSTYLSQLAASHWKKVLFLRNFLIFIFPSKLSLFSIFAVLNNRMYSNVQQLFQIRKFQLHLLITYLLCLFFHTLISDIKLKSNSAVSVFSKKYPEFLLLFLCDDAIELKCYMFHKKWLFFEIIVFE